MAKRKKPKPFSAVEAAKTMARVRIGAPPASRVVVDKKSKAKRNKKHKEALERTMVDAE